MLYHLHRPISKQKLLNTSCNAETLWHSDFYGGAVQIRVLKCLGSEVSAHRRHYWLANLMYKLLGYCWRVDWKCRTWNCGTWICKTWYISNQTVGVQW